jgi:hypothetical protein
VRREQGREHDHEDQSSHMSTMCVQPAHYDTFVQRAIATAMSQLNNFACPWTWWCFLESICGSCD